jgi:hypothetical protein
LHHALAQLDDALKRKLVLDLADPKTIFMRLAKKPGTGKPFRISSLLE